ncbi:hypothetical protein [Rhizobium binae]|uniref:hypothetical protein n=1 Tax=Rhizobium binae TaxID=1138190 RepID=UPI001C830342|nr:hypothetical protein [Rhizobium binae]MBX4929238.1 hypothetical protein [Rhizobium binae]
MALASPLHAVFWHLRKMLSYRSETRARKPGFAENVEYVSHIYDSKKACLFRHFGDFMRLLVFARLVCREKFSKKLTNNFIILCELLRGAVQDSPHMKLSSPALAAQAGF